MSVNVHTPPTERGQHQATVTNGGGLARSECSCGWLGSMFTGEYADRLQAASIDWADHLAKETR